jgi:hypothetical protein
MIFRLSQKLCTRIKAGSPTVLPMDENPFADWSAHLFTADRIQYLLLCNTKSLYSTVMFAKGMTNDNLFITRALGGLREFMAADGQEFVYQQLIAPASASVRFAKALNRSVTGSMNDLIYMAKTYLLEADMPAHEVGFRLNRTPFSALAYANPRKTFTSMLATPIPKSNGKT